MTIHEFIGRLQDVVKSASGWEARCPGHEDRRRSLSVAVADDGKILCDCHAGCSLDHIAGKLGVEVKSLFPTKRERASGPGLGKVVATYTYKDEVGAVLFQVLRYEPKDFRQRRPDGIGGWVFGIKGVRRVLYRLPELLSSDKAAPVWIVEGEKDVENMRQRGAVATCNPGGAGKWNADFGQALKGRHVIIVPDADTIDPETGRCPGRDHADKVHQALASLAASVTICELPKRAGLKDVTNWFEQGGTIDELVQMAREAHQKQKSQALAAGQTLAPSRPGGGDAERAVALSDRYALIAGTSEIWDCEEHFSVKADAFRLLHGKPGALWLKETTKPVIAKRDIVFAPQGCAAGQINTFTGLKIEPRDVPIPLMTQHILNLCGCDESVAHWLTCWMAYPLQHLGAKLQTAVIVHGAQGTGKSLFFQHALSAIYGEYARTISQSTLESRFTAWISRKLFVLAEEVVSNSQLTHLKNKLKDLITSKTVEVELKGLDTREEENHANFVFLSNNLIPSSLDTDDRRHLVIRFDQVESKAYYKALADEIANGGVAGLYRYLLHYDCGDFCPASRPPDTQAKKDLTELGESSPLRFLRLWAAGELPVPFASATADGLYRAFRAWVRTNREFPVSCTRFGKEAKAAISRGALVGVRKTESGSPRLYIVADVPHTTEFDAAVIGYCKDAEEDRL